MSLALLWSEMVKAEYTRYGASDGVPVDITTKAITEAVWTCALLV